MEKSKKMKKLLPAGETATFCRQMSLIMDAGIPVYDGIESLVESCEDEKSRKAFENLSETVRDTGSLYKAVRDAGYFPDYMVNMINIGEETGKLDDVLKSLAGYYNREERTRKTIKSAISYPILLVCMMTAVILALVTKIMPIFEDIFMSLGTNMTETGISVMNIGLAIGNVSLVIIAVILVIIAVSAILTFIGKSDTLIKIASVIPGVRSLNKKISSGRFASVISMMLASGYSLEKALEMAPSIVSDFSVKEKIEKCGKLVTEGVSFPEALGKIGLFSKMESRIISVGYKAGQLDSVMLKVSEAYEEEVNEGIEKTVGYIEPCLVGILSLVIGGILISVMLPLASIMSSIG